MHAHFGNATQTHTNTCMHVHSHIQAHTCMNKSMMSACGRSGARKIQIIMRWLGTGQLVKIAGQFVELDWLKVKFV